MRDINIELKSWDHGKEAGKTKLRIKFMIQTHIKQMQVCVRTENGISEFSPVFTGEESNNKSTVS
jgi:hypothetical protein